MYQIWIFMKIWIIESWNVTAKTHQYQSLGELIIANNQIKAHFDDKNLKYF